MIEDITLDLSSLLAYDAVLLQCHDNPDPDTISSAFALSCFFFAHGVPTMIFYGGFREISKPNIIRMIDALRIHIRFVGTDITRAQELCPQAKRPLLITVDCQYGSSNVSRIECENICIIDHHIMDGDQSVQYAIVNPYVGSCATLVWTMLRQAGFDVKDRLDASTALYYGLYTDTNSLSEVYHPLDLDMLDILVYDAGLVQQLRNNNITRDELRIASDALRGVVYEPSRGIALAEAAPCDPNILGWINDLVRQVEEVDVCIGYCPYHDGVRLSIRSNQRSVMANELAAFLTKGSGSGGGTMDKAGGFLRLPENAIAPNALLSGRLDEYFSDCDVLVAGSYKPKEGEMLACRKKKQMSGYVVLDEVCPNGTWVIVRSALGDLSYTVDEESYLLVGSDGEVRPIQREAFDKCYVPVHERFVYKPPKTKGSFYSPTIRESLYGKQLALLPHVRACHPKEDIIFWAKRITRRTKLFTPWYPEGYIAGEVGDYLTIRAKDFHDVLIETPEVFASIFELDEA